MNSNWDMIGHGWAVELLRGQVARGQARHAYLFCGPAGVGRRTLALRLAQMLNCTGVKNIRNIEGEPCGECRECKQIEDMRHPDLAIIQADDEGGVLKVEQIRELRRVLALKPYQSRFRVAMILRFQEATDSAANALLKTLEEAPAHAILILTAEQSELLLPTITSRCEVLNLRPLALPSVESALIKRGKDPESARLIAHLSGGRPGFAFRMAADEHILTDRLKILNELEQLLEATRLEKFSFADQLAKDRGSMRQTLLIWLSYWRDVLLMASGSELSVTNIDRKDEIERLALKLKLPGTRRLVNQLVSALEQVDRNVNSRLIAEVLLLDWP